MSKKFLVNIFLVILSLGIGLLIIEIILRNIYLEPNYHFFEYNKKGYIFNESNFSDTIAVSPKNIVFEGQKIKQYTMFLNTNSQGFRGNKEYTYQKENGKRRVILFGDSIAFGFPIPEEKTFARITESQIPQLEIMNSSSILSHTARNFDIYEKEINKYESDLAILQGLVGGDLEDHITLDQHGSTQYEIFTLNGKGFDNFIQIKKDIAGNDNLTIKDKNSNKIQEIIDFLNKNLGKDNFLYKNFYFYRLFDASKKILTFPVKNFLNSYSKTSGPIGNISKSYFNNIDSSNQKQESEIYFKTLSYIKAFSLETQKNNSGFLFILVPNRFGCTSLNYSNRQNLLKELDKLNINYINFYDSFCPNGKPDEKLYLKDEFHINESGNELISVKLVDYLKTHIK